MSILLSICLSICLSIYLSILPLFVTLFPGTIGRQFGTQFARRYPRSIPNPFQITARAEVIKLQLVQKLQKCRSYRTTARAEITKMQKLQNYSSCRNYKSAEATRLQLVQKHFYGYKLTALQSKSIRSPIHNSIGEAIPSQISATMETCIPPPNVFPLHSLFHCQDDGAVANAAATFFGTKAGTQSEEAGGVPAMDESAPPVSSARTAADFFEPRALEMMAYSISNAPHLIVSPTYPANLVPI